MSEGDVDSGTSKILEPTEKVLEPEELTRAIITTLRTDIYKPAVALFYDLQPIIAAVPDMAKYSEIIVDSAINTNADIEAMTKISENALRGEEIEIVSRSEATARGQADRSFIYLGHLLGQDSEKPTTIVKAVTPEELNGLLLRTVENRTVQSLTWLGGYAEMPFVRNPNHPDEKQINSVIDAVAGINNDLRTLQTNGYKAMKGEAIPIIQNPQGQQVFALNTK